MPTSRPAALAGLALAAALVLGLPTAPAPAATLASTASKPTVQATKRNPHICRVKDHAGGTTCTSGVTEKVCAAIAREVRSSYSWVLGDCP